MLEVIAGYDRVWSSQLLNGGRPVAYPDDATFDAAVWPGAGLATLFSPTLAWLDAAIGTYTLRIAAGQTAALDPAEYRLQVGVTDPDTGLRSPAFDGTIVVKAAPGSGTAGLPACSYADMLLYGDQVAALASRTPTDGPGFLAQRLKETREFHRDLVLRYRPRPNFAMVRGTVYDPVSGYDTQTDTPPPTKKVITVALAANGLILEDKAREIVARRSVALVYERQNSRDFIAEANRQRAVADELFACYVAQIDLGTTLSPTTGVVSGPPDGVPDVEIGRDATFLPAGAAP